MKTSNLIKNKNQWEIRDKGKLVPCAVCVSNPRSSWHAVAAHMIAKPATIQNKFQEYFVQILSNLCKRLYVLQTWINNLQFEGGSLDKYVHKPEHNDKGTILRK